MKIPLGFEVKTGHAIEIPLRHTAVIGRTQHGKTITLEALIDRAKLRALAFVTKRGEEGFTRGRIIPPFFQEPGDTGEPMWMFISSLLETAVGEKLKKQRACIMRVSKASAAKNMSWDKPTTLLDVANNVRTALEHTRSGFFQDMYLELDEYFQIIMPQIDRLPKSTRLNLKPGINIMFLDGLPDEMQALCIASCCKWCRTEEKKTITILPEAWKFTGKSTPALGALRQLVREGSVLENFVWVDSQDLVGIDAEIRKQIGVWILGVQGESIEAERTIKQLPSVDLRKIKLADVQQLRKGHFFVSWGEGTRQVYVQPSWMAPMEAQIVAITGTTPRPAPKALRDSEDEMWREQAEKAEADLKELKQQFEAFKTDHAAAIDRLEGQLHIKSETIKDLQTMLDRRPQGGNGTAEMARTMEALPAGSSAATMGHGIPLFPVSDRNETAIAEEAEFFVNDIWPRVRMRITEQAIKDPIILNLLLRRPEINLSIATQEISLTSETLRGKLAGLVAEDYFNKPVNGNTAYNELKRRGASVAKPNVYKELDNLAAMGIVTKEDTGYQRVPGIKITRTQISSQ